MLKSFTYLFIIYAQSNTENYTDFVGKSHRKMEDKTEIKFTYVETFFSS